MPAPRANEDVQTVAEICLYESGRFSLPRL